MNRSRTTVWLGVGFVAASFVVAVVAYPTVPDQMAIRWWVGLDLSLHVDYASKTVGLFVVPTLSAVAFVAFYFALTLVDGSVAEDPVTDVFAYLATGIAGLFLLVELGLVWLN